jgi:transposase
MRAGEGGRPSCPSLFLLTRSRVLAAIDEGFSCRQAAARFGVSASSAIRWQALRLLGGDGRPKPQGGDRLSRCTEQHGDLIRALLVETPNMTLPELKARLAQSGAPLSVAALWRFCKRHKLTRKKRPRMRTSRIGLTSWRGERLGSRASSILIPSVSFSSTKPGPQPIWHARMGVARGESGCDRAFPFRRIFRSHDLREQNPLCPHREEFLLALARARSIGRRHRTGHERLHRWKN